MLDGKLLSAAIRKRKKNLLRPDWDVAGQEALDPTAVEDLKQNARVSEILDNPDHEPATEAEMGENESSQDKMALKRAMARIATYIDSL